jgi:hypothetical protein
MEKDPRYHSVKALIETGRINRFSEIFLYIPKSVLAYDLKINNARMSTLIVRTEQFSLEQLFKIAELIETDKRVVFELAYQEYLFNQSNKRK